MKMKTVLILGSGGHGLIPLLEFMLGEGNQNKKFYVVLNCVDDGGDTGRSFDVLEEMFPTISSSIRPVGDLRNNIVTILEELNLLYASENDGEISSYRSKAEILSLRTSEVDDIDTNLKSFFELLQNTPENANELAKLKDFVNENSEKYVAYFSKLYPDAKISVGNLILNLTQVFCTQNEIGFMDFVSNELNLIPDNIEFLYEHPERLRLQAKDLNGELQKGESVIDTLDRPLDPDTYVYVGQNTNVISADDINPVVTELVRKSDLIILPTGSIANAFPIVKILTDSLKQVSDRIINLINVTRTENEVGLPEQIRFINSMVGDGVTHLLPKPIADVFLENGLEHVIKRYKNESKEVMIPDNDELALQSQTQANIRRWLPIFALKKTPDPNSTGKPIINLGLRHFRGYLANLLNQIIDAGINNIDPQQIEFSHADNEIIQIYKLSTVEGEKLDVH